MVQMRRRQPSPVVSFIGLAAYIVVNDARAIYDFPMEIRKRNYVRLSTEKCDECVTLEDFYGSNPFAFVLFYERALMGGNKYKEAVVKGWMDVCKELRWSRIACGLVDMVSDRAYAERYIDPKTAPAHIVVRNGEPIMALKEQVDVLMKRPGDKDIMLGHVVELLKDSATRGNLTISAQATGKEALQRLLKKHRLAIVAFTGEEKGLAEAFRAGVQEAVLAQGMDIQVNGAPSDTSSDSGRKGKGKSDKEKDKEKWRVAFITAHGPANFETSATRGSIAAFVDGVLQPGALTMNSNAKPGDPEVLETIKKVTVDAGLQAAGGSSGKKKGEEL